MTQCPRCRGADINETRRIDPPPEALDRWQIPLLWIFRSCLGAAIFGSFIAIAILVISLSPGEADFWFFCLGTLIIFFLVISQRIARAVWPRVVNPVSWLITGLSPERNLPLIYQRTCDSCGLVWERPANAAWPKVKMTTRCRTRGHEFATTAFNTTRCVYCGSRRVEIVDTWPEVGRREVKKQERLLRAPAGGQRRMQIVEGLKFLFENGSPRATEALAEVVTWSEGDSLQEKALRYLDQLSDQDSIDAVCAVWAATRDGALAALLAKHGWVASLPMHVRALSALKFGKGEPLLEVGVEIVEPLAYSCEDSDVEIADRALSLLSGIDNDEMRAALGELLIKRDFPIARQAIVEMGYAPKDERHRALFFFMTEQWERYDLLDFDREFLNLSYSLDQELRPRIRQKLRASGRADFLQAITGESIRARTATMVPGEFDLVVQTLTANQEWKPLWDLVFEMPFTWSIGILRTLVNAGWSPSGETDRDVYRQLVPLIEDELPESREEIHSLLPPAMHLASASVTGRINDLAFSPSSTLIAIGIGTRRLVEWNYQVGERARLVRGFEHSIGHVEYTGNGVLICGERTILPDESCDIFALDGDHRSRLGGHTGSVTDLVRVGDARIISSGRDGDVVLWDVATMSQVSRRTSVRFDQWVRSMAVSPELGHAALMHTAVELVSLPQLETISSKASKGIVQCATFLPDGEVLIAGMYNGRVNKFTRSGSGKLIRQRESITKLDARVRGVELRGQPPVLIAADSGGEIRFFDPENGTVLGSVQSPFSNLTALRISPDGAFMAVGNSEASFSLWELRGLDLRSVLTQPFASASREILPKIRAMLNNQGLAAPLRSALLIAMTILRHRFRFDIELGEAPSILAGEFDIEID